MTNTSSIEVVVGTVTSDEKIIKQFGLTTNSQFIISDIKNKMKQTIKLVSQKYPKEHNEMVLSSRDFSKAWETTRVINGDISPLYYLAAYIERYESEIDVFVFGAYLEEPFHTLFIKHFMREN